MEYSVNARKCAGSQPQSLQLGHGSSMCKLILVLGMMTLDDAGYTKLARQFIALIICIIIVIMRDSAGAEMHRPLNRQRQVI